MEEKSSKSKLRALTALVVIIIVVGGLLPIYYFGFNNKGPAITVENGYFSVKYSGNFKNITNTNNEFLFTSNVSRAIVTESGQRSSSLALKLNDGEIFYDAGSGQLFITYTLSVYGQFASNLHPKSLTLTYYAQGPSNQSSFNEVTEAPPYSNYPVQQENLSYGTVGNLAHDGFGASSVTCDFINDSTTSPIYNFSLSAPMEIFLSWYPGSTHLFGLVAQVNGLSEPVNSTIEMSLAEVSK